MKGNCFLCGADIYPQNCCWATVEKSDEGVWHASKICCKSHIMRQYDTHDEKWVKCSYEFDGAEHFNFYEW